MSWYSIYKTSQFVGWPQLVQSIYQRLMQAQNDNPSAENAADDVHSQGFDQPTIDKALQQAIIMVVGPVGDETQLSDGQRHVVQTIRGQIPTEQPQQPDAGINGQGIQLNSV